MDNTETYHQPTHISLCAGYGGIDLGLKRVLPDLRTVAYAEIECAAIELLLARMEGGSLDPAPIWSNLRTFPWEAFSDRVDILSGGYPCQPFSSAGKRLGTSDERHLWPFIADGVRLLRPQICFFENVEGHITLGLSTVVSDLESMGYKVSFGLFSAAEVGAPHRRKRIFILAVADTLPEGLQGCLRESCDPGGVQQQARRGSHSFWPSRPGEPQHAWEPPRVVADANSKQSKRGGKFGELESQTSPEQGEAQKREWSGNSFGNKNTNGASTEPRCEIVANTEFIGRRGRSDGDAQGLCGEIQTARPCDSGAEPAVGDADCGGGEESKHEHSGLPPESSGSDAESVGNAEMSRRLQSGTDQLQAGINTPLGDAGSEAGESYEAEREAEPEVGGDADGAPDWVGYGELCVSSDNRTDELRMLGNGVCVPTVARAFRVLSAKLLNKR